MPKTQNAPMPFPGQTSGRILEPEVMDEEEEVGAYLDGVATAHLDRLNATFVASALDKLPARTRAPLSLVLDVGTGTGDIPVKLAMASSALQIRGVDRSAAMLDKARALAASKGLARRVRFRRADGRRIPFPDRTFDLVVSNSLLHHLPDPTPVLDDIARVLKPRGSVFIRDLRRPRRDVIGRHIEEHGRFYRGTMHRLFADSVRAAFTESELRRVVEGSRLGRGTRPARVRRQFDTYLVIEVP